MDQKKLKLLALLRKNNREKLTNLSRKTHVPVSTIFESLRNNFSKFILKHTCIVDFSYIGFNIKAMLLIKFKPENKNEGLNYLTKSIFVNSLSRINNGYDVTLEIICKDMNALEDFIEKLELNTKIKKKEVFYLMGDIKKEDFFSNPDLISGLLIENGVKW